MKELSLNNCRLDRRYDVREQLGRGSYAEIYLGQDILASPHSPHVQVVIKALNVFLQNDLDPELERTLVENFQNEAVALDRVRHPNIISRIGHGTARDLKGTVFHYLVLEYLPGGDLQSLLRKEAVPLKRALSYVEQVCAGLGHAHSRGIIHRDIKPQNLLLTRDMATIKIADFGVARVNTSDNPITRVGTNIYAPPEHSPMSAGQTGELGFGKLTPSADIYSLAKTIYTLLTRESPRDYANQEIAALPEQCRSEEWADELVRVLKVATMDDPARRHRSVEEFWGDLEGLRKLVSYGESETLFRAVSPEPQPHVSRGYSPIAPAQPSFEAIAAVPSSLGDVNPPSAQGVGHLPSWTLPASSVGRAAPPQPSAISGAGSKQKRRRSRRVAAFLVVIGLFTGVLYGTASYMRGRGILPEFSNPFAERTAVANTDIYLRPAPNTDNEPIGLVTKNSKVRIVNTRNNWYQVDVVQQGRVRPSEANATRGWLNGKYLDTTDN